MSEYAVTTSEPPRLRTLEEVQYAHDIIFALVVQIDVDVGGKIQLLQFLEVIDWVMSLDQVTTFPAFLETVDANLRARGIFIGKPGQGRGA